MSITVETMKDRLLTLNEVRETLSATEPLSTRTFSIGDPVQFTVAAGWQETITTSAGTDAVAAVIGLPGGTEYQLTKDALLEATSICGISKSYAVKCPAGLLEPQLNYWFQGGLANRPIRDFQLLIAAGLGAAITRKSVVPFSNLRLLDEALDGITARYGPGEILADYKFTHTLRRTHLRLIVPEYRRAIIGTGTDDDTWSVGLQVKNSLIGEERTSVDGYLFRWWCTNGSVDTRSTSGTWTRRGGGSDTEVYEWARSAVDDILGGLEPALDGVQEMVAIPIEGRANDVLRDVFEHYRVPLPERARIIENMVDTGGALNMYTVMQAITQVANDFTLDPSHVDNLMRMGGDLPHAATARCDETNPCRRMLPH